MQDTNLSLSNSAWSKGVYLWLQVLTFMRRIEQTKLSDFTEPKEETPSSSLLTEKTASLSVIEPQPPRPKGKMWYKTINEDEEWGVCNFDGTVLLAQIINNRLHIHGEEAVCKWCGGVLDVRDDKVFCVGACKRYQGEFSDDLDSFLH